MQIQNFSSATDGRNDQDKTRKRNSIERDLVMQESDYRKRLSEKTQLEAEIRQLKKDESHIKLSVQEKQARLERIDQEIFQMDTEIKSLKRKLNSL